jgi:D-sedoheptulose 7-phosphate isomerase
MSLSRDYLAMARDAIRRIPVKDIDKAVDLLYETWENEGTVFACGNGGSASTAQHFACDLAKTTIVEGKGRVEVWCLNDNMPLISALTNDEGFDKIFSEQLIDKIRAEDLLICLSVHGGVGEDKAGAWSQNLLKAVDYAHQQSAKVLGFSGFDGGELARLADVCITVPANSTPIVESLHCLLEHVICQCLRERIENAV